MFHCLTFRQKKSEASKADAAAAAAAMIVGRAEKQVKIQSFDEAVRPAQGQLQADQKPKRSHSINKKVDDFIARTKMKIIRSVSGVAAAGSHPPT